MTNLSVRLSVTHGIVSKRMHIVKFFPSSGMDMILVNIERYRQLQNYKGNSISGRLNTRGGKYLQFSTEIALYLIYLPYLT